MLSCAPALLPVQPRGAPKRQEEQVGSEHSWCETGSRCRNRQGRESMAYGVADGGGGDLEESPWERILIDIARPILQSEDIRQALDQAEAGPGALNELIRARAAQLILSADSATTEFVEQFDLFGFLLSGTVLKLAGTLLAVLIAITTLNLGLPSMLHWALVPCNILIVLMGVYAVIILLRTFEMPVGPLEPTDRTREELAQEVLEPLVREEINRMLDEQDHPAVLHVTSAPGLSELGSRERLVATRALRALGRLSKDMSSGSIGVSGPRGVGKTTLLRYFCDPSFEAAAGDRDAVFTARDIRFMVAAPVDYDAREFILHVFSKLCTQVQEFESTHERGSSHFRAGGGERRGLLIALAACLIAAAYFVPPEIWPRAFGSGHPWTTPVTVILAVLVCAVGLVFWGSPGRALRSRHHPQSLAEEARAWQQRIRYAHTFTAGSSGSVGLPRALQLGVSSSHQLEEVPITLPELVEAMRDFAMRAIRARQLTFRSWYAGLREIDQIGTEPSSGASRLSRATVVGETDMISNPTERRNQLRDRYLIPNHKPRIVIGIDEIDKMNADSAKRFLNDIKAIFGMLDCLYLVSVSDEALQIYEQRILLGRTAFDSAFDEISRVQPLDFDSCRHLLRGRIAGIPDSLIAFCQVMSGGVPRDMIRAARAVLDARARGNEQVADIVLDLIADEIDVLKRTSIASFDSTGANLGRFPAEALGRDWPGRTSEEILAAIENGFPDGELALHFRAGLYFYCTVAEVFSTRLPDTIGLLRRFRLADGAHIDRLAEARNAISVNPVAAWDMVSQFRAARGFRGLNEPATPG
jgi:TRAP-type C4-dicarboxylate transport system permease small subunit